MHSENFQKVKRFYNMKIWKINRVRDAVASGWITEAEFTEITGEDY